MHTGVFLNVSDAVYAAKSAWMRYTKLTFNQRQEIIEGIKESLRGKIEEIATMTVHETGMGNAPDKAKKLRLAIEKTPGIEDLVTEVNTGDHGMTLYELSAFGVACAIHPCTNPCATLISNTIGMLAAGNAIIHCPHPRAIHVSHYVTGIINRVISQISGIDNLVITIDQSMMMMVREMMAHPDISLVVCTGGTHLLRQAMASGKKVIGAGPANPVAIVDETAVIERAARDIIQGASFDHNLMCTSEKSVVVVNRVADAFVEALKVHGVYYIHTKEEMLRLLAVTVTENMENNKKLEGKSANEILKSAQIPCAYPVKLIAVETAKNHPFVVLELLMPILPIVRVHDFDEALESALEIEQGYKHTATIHSESIEHLNRAAKEMQTAVFVKNGCSLLGIGFDLEGHTSFTIATATGEGTTSARHFTRRRRCTLTSGFSIR